VEPDETIIFNSAQTSLTLFNLYRSKSLVYRTFLFFYFTQIIATTKIDMKEIIMIIIIRIIIIIIMVNKTKIFSGALKISF
jgi:hypothetical protein